MKILFVILFIILPFNLNAKENNIIYEVYVLKIISDNIQKMGPTYLTNHLTDHLSLSII